MVIVGIAGSVLSGSYNAALLPATAQLMPSRASPVIMAIAGIPPVTYYHIQ